MKSPANRQGFFLIVNGLNFYICTSKSLGMNIEQLLTNGVIKAFHQLYGENLSSSEIQIKKTRKEHEGDFTLVVFPLLGFSGKSPENTGVDVGEYLAGQLHLIAKYNAIKGFLNMTVDSSYWLEILREAALNENFGFIPVTARSGVVMIEYSSPNTNKPLHLGHIRNNLLGYSLCRILEANGNRVVKTNIVNDRGIHICKSMLAWQQWGEGRTPGSTGIKGDHLVGEFYVMFDKQYKKEIAGLMEAGFTREEAENNAPSMIAARGLLRKWEAGDQETVGLWKMMNSWVYEGFDKTYRELGVGFDKIYYESETYLTGKDEVLEGLKRGVFYQKEDGSIWADLTDEGLDHKVLLRSDGTSVYMTQDIGTAKMRFNDYVIDKMIYVVGNEQNYHFQVLAILLGKLGFEWGRGLHHFSYGMVELPSGKMKSREGTVVDADDLISEMVMVARNMSVELGKLDSQSEEEAEKSCRQIALGALKYFILKVDPKKNMLFNPDESIDFNGNTGPFIQYTYARIRSIFRKAEEMRTAIPGSFSFSIVPEEKELELIKLIAIFPEVVRDAGEGYSPALIANYCYDLSKSFNQFYHEITILGESDGDKKDFKMILSEVVARTLKNGMGLLGIEMPERM